MGLTESSCPARWTRTHRVKYARPVLRLSCAGPPPSTDYLSILVSEVAQATKLAYRMTLTGDRPSYLLFELDNFDELHDLVTELTLQPCLMSGLLDGPLDQALRSLIRQRARIAVWEVYYPTAGGQDSPSALSLVSPQALSARTTPPAGLSRAKCQPNHSFSAFGGLAHGAICPCRCTSRHGLVGARPLTRQGTPATVTPPLGERHLLGHLRHHGLQVILQCLRAQTAAFAPEYEPPPPVETEDCAICLERSVSEVLPCAHAFCESCLNQWFVSQLSCPLCRADVDSKRAGPEFHDSWELTLPPVPSEARREFKTILARLLRDYHPDIAAHDQRLRMC